MSHTSSLFHIVFATKNRAMAIDNADSEKIYRYIWSKLEQANCKLIRIGGMPDHIHMLVDINPTISLSELMRNLKAESSWFLQNTQDFPNFQGWGKGYFAASVSFNSKDSVIEYIKTQRDHHRVYTFQEELDRIYAEVCARRHPKDFE